MCTMVNSIYTYSQLYRFQITELVENNELSAKKGQNRGTVNKQTPAPVCDLVQYNTV